MADEINHLDAPTDVVTDAPMEVIAARFDRADWLSFAATSLLALAIYLFTLAPNVTLEFSGLLSTAAFYAGVAHPAGYPVWTIYSWLFITLVPFSNIAWRVSVGSAVAAALASGIVALTVSFGAKLLMEDLAGFEHWTSQNRKWIRRVCGLVAAMALGFSGPVWREAIIADVWTLSLLLFTAMLCVLLRWLVQPVKKRFLCAGFLLFGLLLTGNQEMIVALPGLVFMAMLGDRNLGRDLVFTVLPLAATLTRWDQFGLWIDFPHRWNLPVLIAFGTVATIGLAIVFFTRRFSSAWRFALPCNISFLLGFSLCLYLPIASMTNPPVNSGYPRTPEGFFHVLSRGQYERVFPTDDFGRYANQLWAFVKMSGKELGWLYVFLAALPLFEIPRINPTARKYLLALVMMFICAGPVLIAEMNPPSGRFDQELWIFCLLPAYAIITVLAGLGLVLCVRLVGGSRFDLAA